MFSRAPGLIIELMRTVLLVLLCATLPSFGQQKPAPPKQLTEQDVVRLHTTWGARMNHPGSTLTLKEAARKGNTFSIQFVATGLPRDRRYNLISFPTSRADSIILVRGIWLDASGRAMCAEAQGKCEGSKQKSAPLTMKVSPAPGEPMRVALAATDDSSIAAFANQALIPLVAGDRGCRLEAVVVDPRNAMMHLIATGLPPNGSFTLTSESGGKATVMNLTADRTGRYSTGILPTRPATTSGLIQLKLLASTCRPVLTVPYTLVR
jgi:hypothetical protein